MDASGGLCASRVEPKLGRAEAELLSRAFRLLAPQRARKKRRQHRRRRNGARQQQEAVSAAVSAGGGLPRAQKTRQAHRNYQPLAVAGLRVPKDAEVLRPAYQDQSYMAGSELPLPPANITVV